MEPEKLARIPKTLRWILVLPVAFLVGLIAEMLPRILFSVVEIAINHTLLFRPGFDTLVWQAWAPFFFVAAGIRMAPANRFLTFLIVGGLKITIAVANLVQVVEFIGRGGGWGSIDEIVKSPLWWNTSVYVLCFSGLTGTGIILAKQWLDERRNQRHRAAMTF